MGNIFYNIVSIVVGTILLAFFSYQIYKNKKLAFGILGIVLGILFIRLGVFGFFLPKDYEFITVLGMLALTVIMILILLLSKKEKE